MSKLRTPLSFVAAVALALAASGCSGSMNPTAPSGANAQAALMGTRATSAAGPQGDCPNDSKLLGLFEVSTDYRPGTWWYLSRNSLVEAGFTTDAALEQKLEEISGTSTAVSRQRSRLWSKAPGPGTRTETSGCARLSCAEHVPTPASRWSTTSSMASATIG